MSAKARYTGAEVQSQVWAYCRTLGLAMERRNVGAARYRNLDGTERLVRYGHVGDSDLTGVIPDGPNRGKRLDIELKATGEEPTMAQFDRLVRLNQAGGIGLWFDSLDTAMAVLPHVLKGARVRYVTMTEAEVYYPEPEAPRGILR